MCTAGSDESIDPEGYHNMLVLNYEKNNSIALRKTKKPRYFESAGGIYLGMDKDDVIKLYGQPSSMDVNIWKYREGFDVLVRDGIVYKITIYRNSDRRFDYSGLSASDSLQTFLKKYNTTRHRKGSISIGHGEVIVMKDNEVSLVFFTPGYVL